MGKTLSTQKTIESSGEVNNNVVINEPFHETSGYMHLLVVLWIICAIKIIEFAFFIYNRHQKQLKKRYTNNPS